MPLGRQSAIQQRTARRVDQHDNTNKAGSVKPKGEYVSYRDSELNYMNSIRSIPRVKVGAPGPTHPSTPSLLSDERIQLQLARLERIKNDLDREHKRNMKQVKARAIPASVITGNIVKPKNAANTTAPLTPNITNPVSRAKPILETHQLVMADEASKIDEYDRIFSVVNVKHVQKQPEHTQPKQTAPIPFKVSDETKRIEKLKQIEDMKKAEQEEMRKMAEFKARPLNKKMFEKVQQPVKSTQNTGNNSEEIILSNQQSREDDFETEVAEQMKKMENNGVYNFKARALPKSTNEPFKVSYPEPVKTQPEAFHLHTAERGEKRAEYEKELQKKRMKDENDKFLEQLRNLEEERMRSRMERERTAFKARPLPRSMLK